MSQRNYLVLLTVSFIAFGSTVQGIAHDGAKGLVKDRMDMMKDIGANMKVLARMAQGKRTFDPALAVAAATAISAHSGNIAAMFPAGSDGHPSEASKAIWDEWSRFESLASQLAARANLLAEKVRIVESMAAVKPEFGHIADTCKSCHETFRIKK